jgi:hypothetical protein
MVMTQPGLSFFQLPEQVVLPGLGRVAAVVEVGAQVLVWRAGLEDLVDDLEQAWAIAMIARLTAPYLLFRARRTCGPAG